VNDPGIPPKIVNEVRVIDVKMPFWSMVTFMVQWAIATIPALLLLLFIIFGVASFMTVIFGKGCPALFSALSRESTPARTPTPSPTHSFR
jgi:hypothetical protein